MRQMYRPSSRQKAMRQSKCEEQRGVKWPDSAKATDEECGSRHACFQPPLIGMGDDKAGQNEEKIDEQIGVSQNGRP
jgi:hypothetical protein